MTKELSTDLYFFYGTLQDPKVLEIVLADLRLPQMIACSSLKGFELKRARGEDFPILVKSSDPTVCASGTLFHGIGTEARERLIYFEGEEYNLLETKIGDQSAWCFFPSELGYGVDGEWDLESWRQETLKYELYLKQVADYMKYYGSDEKFIWKS